MGKYINNASTGKALPATGKADLLIEDGATEVAGDKFEENLICIVDNGFFDAAAYAYSESEYDEFKREDGRPKRWVTHPKAKEIAM